jgi:hypothetical protein
MMAKCIYYDFFLKYQKERITNAQKSIVREVVEIMINFPQTSTQ